MIVKTKLMLVGLACILKANPSMDVQKAEAGLSQEQVDFVAEVAASDVCGDDDKIQVLLNKTQQEQTDGRHQGASPDSCQHTLACDAAE